MHNSQNNVSYQLTLVLTNPLLLFLFQDYPNSFNPTTSATSTSSSHTPVHGILLRCTAQLAVFYRHSWVVLGNNHHQHYHLSLSILQLPTIPPSYYHTPSGNEPLQDGAPQNPSRVLLGDLC